MKSPLALSSLSELSIPFSNTKIFKEVLKCTINSQDWFPLTGLFSRFYQVLWVLIPDVHVQLLYSGWQRADGTSRWALSKLAAQQHWDHVSNPWVRSPAQDGAQGSLLTRFRSLGHGETGSKWRWQALREDPWWMCMYRRQTGYSRVRHN